MFKYTLILVLMMLMIAGCGSSRDKYGESDVVLDGLKGSVKTVRLEQLLVSKVDAQGMEHNTYDWQKTDHYDQKDNKIKHENGSWTEDYTLDEAGNRMRTNYSFKDKGIFSPYFYQARYTRNAKGEVIEIENYLPEKFSNTRTEYKYSNETNERVGTFFSENNTLTGKTVDSYYPNGTVKNVRSYQIENDEFVLTLDVYYYYDDEGLLTMREVVKSAEPKTVMEMYYDKDGNEIEYKKLSDETEPLNSSAINILLGNTHTIFEYQYDEYGNRVRKIHYQIVEADTETKKNKMYTYVREIEYYENAE